MSEYEFYIGDNVLVKDTEYETWDGVILDIDPVDLFAFVNYATDTESKYRWVSFEELGETNYEFDPSWSIKQDGSIRLNEISIIPKRKD
jgi:hypothetical protein